MRSESMIQHFTCAVEDKSERDWPGLIFIYLRPEQGSVLRTKFHGSFLLSQVTSSNISTQVDSEFLDLDTRTSDQSNFLLYRKLSVWFYKWRVNCNIRKYEEATHNRECRWHSFCRKVRGVRGKTKFSLFWWQKEKLTKMPVVWVNRLTNITTLPLRNTRIWWVIIK